MNTSRIIYLKNELKNTNKTLAILEVTKNSTKANVKFLTKEKIIVKKNYYLLILNFLFDILSISFQKKKFFNQSRA